MIDYLETYRRMFAHSEYALHPADEARYLFCSRHLRNRPFQSLLDLGAGRGTLLLALQDEFSGVAFTAADLANFHQLDVPHHNLDLSDLSGCRLLCALPHDVITCTDTLEHLAEPHLPEAIAAIARSCKLALLTVSTHSDMPYGEELHLTQRPSVWWRQLLAQHATICEEELLNGGLTTGFVLESRHD